MRVIQHFISFSMYLFSTSTYSHDTFFCNFHPYVTLSCFRLDLAGDLGYDPLGLFKKKTDAQKDEMRLKELKNGRLAMIAMAAYTSEHWIPGSVPISFTAFGLSE